MGDLPWYVCPGESHCRTHCTHIVSSPLLFPPLPSLPSPPCSPTFLLPLPSPPLSPLASLLSYVPPPLTFPSSLSSHLLSLLRSSSPYLPLLSLPSPPCSPTFLLPLPSPPLFFAQVPHFADGMTRGGSPSIPHSKQSVLLSPPTPLFSLFSPSLPPPPPPPPPLISLFSSTLVLTHFALVLTAKYSQSP